METANLAGSQGNLAAMGQSLFGIVPVPLRMGCIQSINLRCLKEKMIGAQLLFVPLGNDL